MAADGLESGLDMSRMPQSVVEHAPLFEIEPGGGKIFMGGRELLEGRKK
jgi:hypothetical protein